MNMTRRGLLFGAVAIQAGILLPKALAEELSLPPPTPEAGQKLLVPAGHRGTSIINLDDSFFGHQAVTVMRGDSVMGSFLISNMQWAFDPEVHVHSLGDAIRRPHVSYYGRQRIELSLVQVA